MDLQQRCPTCGAPMVVRENRQNGSEFLGCTRFPDCRETAPLPAYVEMLKAGAQRLPGWD